MGLTQEMNSLANAPSVKFNSQLSLNQDHPETIVHYVHNETTNSVIVDSLPSSGGMTLNIGSNLDGSSGGDTLFRNGFQVGVLNFYLFVYVCTQAYDFKSI